MFARKLRLHTFLLLFISVINNHSFAQNSPYSILGLGNLQTEAYVPQQMMGGIGASTSNLFSINNINPALLPKNKQFIFDVAATGMLQELKSPSYTQKEFSGNVGYFGLAFPVINSRWTMQLGLKPYSSVEYEIRTSDKIPNSDFTANYTYVGSGGLNTFQFSNGVKIWDELYLGLKVAYIFGNLKSESTSQVNVGGINTDIVYLDRKNIGDFAFSPAMAYSYKLKNKTQINVGVVYDLEVNAKSKIFSSIERRSLVGFPLSVDTITTEEKGKVVIPQKLRIGLSYEKPLVWSIGADMVMQNWQDYTEFGISQGLENSMMLAFGGEYTPDYRAIRNTLKRMTYRAGISYQKTPLNINGKQVSDFGINFGTSLPIGVNQFATTNLHLGFTLGQRGSLEDNKIQEKYFKISLGASLSDFLWFKRPKIN